MRSRKKVETHAYAVALQMMYYTVVRIHQTLRVTPAMAAGATDKLWEIGDIAALIEADEAPEKKAEALQEAERLDLLGPQLIGNAGLYHVARELSRRGWHVTPTVCNAQADLYASSGGQEIVISIQSRALSSKAIVPLGTDLESFRSRWWVITVNAKSPFPVCYVMTLDEVKAGAHRFGDAEDGDVSYWLDPKAYALDCYFEAWHRLGDPISN